MHLPRGSDCLAVCIVGYELKNLGECEQAACFCQHMCHVYKIEPIKMLTSYSNRGGGGGQDSPPRIFRKIKGKSSFA